MKPANAGKLALAADGRVILQNSPASFAGEWGARLLRSPSYLVDLEDCCERACDIASGRYGNWIVRDPSYCTVPIVYAVHVEGLSLLEIPPGQITGDAWGTYYKIAKGPGAAKLPWDFIIDPGVALQGSSSGPSSPQPHAGGFYVRQPRPNEICREYRYIPMEDVYQTWYGPNPDDLIPVRDYYAIPDSDGGYPTIYWSRVGVQLSSGAPTSTSPSFLKLEMFINDPSGYGYHFSGNLFTGTVQNARQSTFWDEIVFTNDNVDDGKTMADVLTVGGGFILGAGGTVTLRPCVVVPETFLCDFQKWYPPPSSSSSWTPPPPSSSSSGGMPQSSGTEPTSSTPPASSSGSSTPASSGGSSTPASSGAPSSGPGSSGHPSSGHSSGPGGSSGTPHTSGGGGGPGSAPASSSSGGCSSSGYVSATCVTGNDCCFSTNSTADVHILTKKDGTVIDDINVTGAPLMSGSYTKTTDADDPEKTQYVHATYSDSGEWTVTGSGPSGMDWTISIPCGDDINKGTGACSGASFSGTCTKSDDPGGTLNGTYTWEVSVVINDNHCRRASDGSCRKACPEEGLP